MWEHFGSTTPGGTYIGAFTLTDGHIAPANTTFTHTIVDAAGAQLTAGMDIVKYRHKVVLTGDGTVTPHVYWVALEVPATTVTHTGEDNDWSDYVQSVNETLSLEDHFHALSVKMVPGGRSAAQTYAPLRYLPNLAGTMTIDGFARSFFYLYDPEYDEFEGTWRLSWLNCENRLRRLKHALISDRYVYDGMKHTDAVTHLFQVAGIAEADFTIGQDYTEARLPTAQDDEDPLFVFSNGTPAFDAITYICKVFSGWSLFVDGDGLFQYSDKWTVEQSSAFKFFPSRSPAWAEGAPETDRLIMEWAQEVDTTQYYNQIWVVGEDSQNNPLYAFWEDKDSWDAAKKPTLAQLTELKTWRGNREPLVYIDPALQTQYQVEWVGEILRKRHGYPQMRASMRALYDANVLPGHLINYTAGNEPGAWVDTYWRIESIETEIAGDASFAWYELLKTDTTQPIWNVG